MTSTQREQLSVRLLNGASASSLNDSLVTKLFACVSEHTLTLAETREILGTVDAATTAMIEIRWKQLEATRRDLGRAYEPLSVALKSIPHAGRVAQLVREGRTSAASNTLIQLELSKGVVDIDGWPSELICALKDALRIRSAEERAGLIPRPSRGRR